MGGPLYLDMRDERKCDGRRAAIGTTGALRDT